MVNIFKVQKAVKHVVCNTLFLRVVNLPQLEVDFIGGI